MLDYIPYTSIILQTNDLSIYLLEATFSINKPSTSMIRVISIVILLLMAHCLRTIALPLIESPQESDPSKYATKTLSL